MANHADTGCVIQGRSKLVGICKYTQKMLERSDNDINDNKRNYCAGGKIEMGGACGAYGEWERCAQGSGGET